MVGDDETKSAIKSRMRTDIAGVPARFRNSKNVMNTLPLEVRKPSVFSARVDVGKSQGGSQSQQHLWLV